MIGAAVAVGAAVTAIATAGRAATRDGMVLGLTLSGLSSLLSGLFVLGWWWRLRARTHRGDLARAMLGIAIVIWACGQLLLVRDAGRGVLDFPALGDTISALAAPLVIVAAVLVPRRSASALPAFRLVLDAIVLGLAGTLSAWWIFFGAAVHYRGLDGVTAPALLIIFLDLALAGLALMVSIRDPQSRAGLGFVAVGLHVIADVSALTASAGGVRQLPWTSSALWCVMWPLAVVAVLRFRTGPNREETDAGLQDRREAWAGAATTVLSVGLLVAGLAFAPNRNWTPETVLLAGALSIAFGLRELLNTGVRLALVTGLRAQAYRDELTGLANRRALTARIATIPTGASWVVLTLDLDSFKEVNDLLGPLAGDELLIAVAGVLRRECPPVGMAARIGGDEFALLCPGDLDAGAARARRLVAAVRDVLSVGGGGVVLSASVGVGRVVPGGVQAPPVPVLPEAEPASAGTEGAEPAAEKSQPLPLGPFPLGPVPLATPAPVPSVPGLPVLGLSVPGLPALRAIPLGPRPGAEADRLTALVESAAALRAAKARGRDQVAVYQGGVAAARQRRLAVERRLRATLDGGRLDVHAQPIVDLRNTEIRGFEALARWHDAELGHVSPSEFVPVAEQTGMIVALGEQVLHAALAQARASGVLGRELAVTVNASPLQLRSPRFVPLVDALLAEYELDPRLLVLEVTEAVLVDDDDPAVEALTELADAGVRIAIDDFGSGYSALGYLRRLPVDVLKVDRSWVVDATRDARTRHVVSSVVELAHKLRLSVVMEGIEDEDIAESCRLLGADAGQGWHFGRPQTWAVARSLVHGESLPERDRIRRPAAPVNGHAAPPPEPPASASAPQQATPWLRGAVPGPPSGR